jgi:protein Xni
MISTLLIIDALNLIRRIYAIQEKQHGETKKAVQMTSLISCNALSKLFKIHAPTHVIAVFDNRPPNWRHTLCSGYKKGRRPIAERLKNGLEQIQDDFFDMGVDSLTSETDEASDLIATLAHKMSVRQQRCIIVSTDKGFYQLLNKQIVIYDHFNNNYIDNIKVLNNMQIKIEQLCDYRALVGCASSCIKGVEGIGKKSATSLIQKYTRLENIFSTKNHTDKRVLKVKDQRQAALLARELLTLKTDITLGFNLQNLRIRY